MYTVDRTESAVHELTSLWVNADPSLRRAVTAASHNIDKDLRHQPNEKGESREGDNRFYFAAPLGIYFRVDESANTAVVVNVWLVSPRKKR
jgi:hypothetical protein